MVFFFNHVVHLSSFSQKKKKIQHNLEQLGIERLELLEFVSIGRKRNLKPWHKQKESNRNLSNYITLRSRYKILIMGDQIQ